MRDFSGAITSNAILINYLDNIRDMSCLAEHQEMTTAKKLHHHVKMFDTIVSIDVLVDNINLLGMTLLMMNVCQMWTLLRQACLM